MSFYEEVKLWVLLDNGRVRKFNIHRLMNYHVYSKGIEFHSLVHFA